MFDKSLLQRDIEAALDALPTDFIQNANTSRNASA